MAIITSVALVLLAQGPVATAQAPDTAFDVGYEELVANDNAAARQAIENCDELAANDPARLINHGIALARTRRMTTPRATVRSRRDMARDSVELETAMTANGSIRAISRARRWPCSTRANSPSTASIASR